jgi:YesN/AraC family two-component response regulator
MCSAVNLSFSHRFWGVISIYTVLIIDDEKPVRQAIITLGHWSALGIGQIYEAVEGESGLDCLREYQPDIILVDMKMPNMDGAKFLEIASRELPLAKYIVISGYDDFEYTKRAIQAKVLDYLLKPVIESELNEALTKAAADLDAAKKPVPKQEIREPLHDDLLPLAGEDMIRNLNAIKDYIDHNFCQEIKLSLFAERYYLSKEYLSKLFKEKFGFNIYEYVLKVRMEKARELLANPGIKVLSIAKYLGYKDNNYFSRAFKTYYGIAPTEYRENLLKNQ